MIIFPLHRLLILDFVARFQFFTRGEGGGQYYSNSFRYFWMGSDRMIRVLVGEVVVLSTTTSVEVS